MRNVIVAPTDPGGYDAHYTSLSLAEAGENGSLADDLTIWCAAMTDTTLLTWAGWTQNGFSVTVEAVSGAGFDGVFTTTGKYVYAPTANAIFAINHANTDAGGLVVTYKNITIRRLAGNSAGFRIAIGCNSGVNTIQLDGCYVETGGTAVTNMMATNVGDAATRILKARNTVFVCPSTSGEGVCQSEALALMYLNNCVIDGKAGAGAGVARITSGTCEVRNSVVFNTSDDFLGTFAAIDSCASDDGDGTNAVTLGSSTEWNACFTDYANGDYTIKDSSAPIYNTGADLSANGNYAVTTDVIGTARPQATTYDIGISELVVGGGGGFQAAWARGANVMLNQGRAA